MFKMIKQSSHEFIAQLIYTYGEYLLILQLLFQRVFLIQINLNINKYGFF